MAKLHKPISANLPLLAGLAVFCCSLLLFGIGLGNAAGLTFDETHYVPAARAIVALTGPANIEHPLFAKSLIALGIELLGDNPLGWRAASVVTGAISVAALYALAWQLVGRIEEAVTAAILLAVNQTHFIQARIAMLEMPMTASLLVAAAILLQARRHAKRSRWEWAAAVALGLAIAAKWAAAPYALLFLAMVAIDHWRGGLPREALVFHMVGLAGIVAVSYLVTFAPAFFYDHDPMTVRHLLAFQFEMLRLQQIPLPAHPYQSVWWQWPLMQRPIWYLFEKSGDAYRAILLVGNPVIYWGGLGLVLATLSGWLRRRNTATWLVLGIYAFSLAIWLVIPKPIGFFYYYNLSAVILCLFVPVFCAQYGAAGRKWLRLFTALACLVFVYFYPVLAASPLPADDTWTDWVWFKTWY